MKQMIFRILLFTIFLVPHASAAVVRGTVSDSATGIPISNVKVVLMHIAGEVGYVCDSAKTGTTGSYSLVYSGSSVSNLFGELYISTLSDNHYFQSTSIHLAGVDDTVTKDLRLKKISTMMLAAPHSRTSHNVTVEMRKSRLYLSGIKDNAVVDIHNVNGRLLFRTVIGPGASEVRLPERCSAAIRPLVISIRINGHLVRGAVVSGGGGLH